MHFSYLQIFIKLFLTKYKKVSWSLISKFKKHFDIFRDTNGEVYIKPNEILKLTNTVDSKFRIRINFLRDLRSTISSVFKSLNNN